MVRINVEFNLQDGQESDLVIAVLEDLTRAVGNGVVSVQMYKEG